MSRLEEIGKLYDSLELLVSRKTTPEDEFQAWFDGNPDVFRVLGFKRAISKPKLELNANNFLEPDFLVEDYNGVWRVFELKRADTVILKNPKRRTDLRAEFSTYVQQCREYARFFLEASNRSQVYERYGIKVQASVPSLIIASVDENSDPAVLHELMVDRGAMVTVQTYTSVLESLGREMDSLEADSAELPGLSVFLLGVFPAKPAVDDQVITDFGETETRNRFSIGLKKGSFVARVFDDSRREHELSVPRPLVLTFENGCQLTQVEAEFGVGNGGFYMGGYLDRRPVMRKFMAERVNIAAGPLLDQVVLGTDITRSTLADFALVEIIVYGRTLSWRERLQIRNHIDTVYAYYLSPLAVHMPHRVTFKGQQSLALAEKHEPPEGSRAPLIWCQATDVRLANGRRLSPDPRLGVPTLRLPGMYSDAATA